MFHRLEKLLVQIRAPAANCLRNPQIACNAELVQHYRWENLNLRLRDHNYGPVVLQQEHQLSQLEASMISSFISGPFFMCLGSGLGTGDFDKIS